MKKFKVKINEKYRFSFFAACFLQLSSCNQRNLAQHELEIQSIMQSYYSTMSAREWEKYREFFWPKATLTTVWKAPDDSIQTMHISTIGEFISKTFEGPDSQPIFEEKMHSCQLEVRNNLAVVWPKYSAKFGTKGDLNEWEGTDLFTLMRHQNQWKIVSLAFESD